MIGTDFFNHFNFIADDDPTHGYVSYQTERGANSWNLLSVDPVTKAVRIKADATREQWGRGRPAVRLSSKNTFNTGLFIIDVNHVPSGNAVWPAFWTFGPNWPNNGEIDIIEGKNDQPNNQSTLHTSSGCTMPTPNPALMTGTFIDSLDCNHVDGTKGCTTQGPLQSFGPGLNAQGGGVFALLWTTSSISVWFFPRAKIPQNLHSSAIPDPTQWGLPVSYFQLGENCPSSKIAEHNVILNTTFCGDWAGTEYSGPNGNGTWACNHFVGGNPSAFTEAYWDINFIQIYSVNGTR